MVTINNDAVIFIIGKKYKGEELLKLGVSMNYEIISFNYYIFFSSKVYFVSMFITLCLIIHTYMYMEVFLNCLKLCY